ncbi:hypothetical protein [Pseudogemmobacter faecipullorum]|uniref:Uncharacterized protein n=1 Tax=Pseudogemmobacter faecipullorum TaxID=2755041 RepID=A0ABS8CJQ8_9RHOB|nr:hypothetical protein [Pseudogemmobacter faecipullorum]MCB5409624.1 hypothetical protein [Pseudogemmobacter faecipullorum]
MFGCSLRFLSVLLLAPAPALAADHPPGPVQSLALAVTLYDQAAGAGDALQMAVAVRLAGGITLREADNWRSEKLKGKAKGLPGLPAPVLDLVLSPGAWSGAQLMAEEDPALADFLALEPPPALQGGVSRAPGMLQPGERVVWHLPFAGQSPAEIAVFPQAAAGEPRALSPLWRVDATGGEPICPARQSPWPACRFTPEANEFVDVVLENPGDAALSYVLISN